MKTNGFLLVALMLFLGFSYAQAPLNKYYGKWNNTDSNTRSIKTVEITKQGTDTYVQVFGSCSPTDCDWGKVKAIPFSGNVSENASSNTEYLMANFSPSFASKTVIIRLEKSGVLSVHTLTEFKGSDSRKDFSSKAKLKKLLVQL